MGAAGGEELWPALAQWLNVDNNDVLQLSQGCVDCLEVFAHKGMVHI